MMYWFDVHVFIVQELFVPKKVKPAEQELHYPLASPVQAEQPVKQFAWHVLSEDCQVYAPVHTLLHSVPVKVNPDWHDGPVH